MPYFGSGRRLAGESHTDTTADGSQHPILSETVIGIAGNPVITFNPSDGNTSWQKMQYLNILIFSKFCHMGPNPWLTKNKEWSII